jgi:hydroxyethylthiazole kinase-like uncharacterized protein yjeF
MERIPEAELAGYLARVPQWTREGVEIARAFTFRNFREAMGFVVQVALLAERADHHPDIDIRYKQVTLRLSTHSAGGLDREGLRTGTADRPTRMMRGIPIVDSEQMRALDRAAIEEDSIPSLVLMERAGYGVFQRIAEWFAPIAGKRVAVLTGKGNNGGDGMVVARYLHEAGAQVHLWLAHSPDEFRGDAAVQWRILQAYGIPALPLPDAPDPALFRDEDLLVDALLGIGARGELSPPLRATIDAVNRSGRPVVAVDIPSGLDADTGVALGDGDLGDLHGDDGAAEGGLFPERRGALRRAVGNRADRHSPAPTGDDAVCRAAADRAGDARAVALPAAGRAQGASRACAGGGRAASGWWARLR